MIKFVSSCPKYTHASVAALGSPETVFQLAERVFGDVPVILSMRKQDPATPRNELLPLDPEQVVVEGTYYVEPAGVITDNTSTVSVAKWVGAHAGGVVDWGPYQFLNIARNGTVEFAQWALANGCPKHPDTSLHAAFGTDPQLLRWALGEGFPWHPAITFHLASDGAGCDCLEGLMEGHPERWDPNTSIAAAWEANLKFMRRACELGCPLNPSAAAIARSCSADTMFSAKQVGEYEEFARWAEAAADGGAAKP